ncbi:MAG TPA: glutamate-1-semialdehyde 2,1-aminomutase [Chloroflexota bacterium]|nr:glutamate-1-semialdehyde 2,1-aminomutase [Chloroflexota bacterium]
MTAETARSDDLYARARRVIPGGVSSPVRAFKAVGATPRFIARAAGCTLVDVDGNDYVDYVMSWGPLINGHAFGPIVFALTSSAAYGTSYGAPTESEVELAEAMVAAMPSVEMVRFVSSGTEATMSAVRLARAATGRTMLVKFAGNYHGHGDALLARAGSGSLTLGVPTSPGVPETVVSQTLVLPYNDVGLLREAFRKDGEAIAAVIVEPIAGNMGVVPPAPGFLEEIRRQTERTGSLFIMDEVITGFRVAHGGAQSRFGLTPDLTTLGKIIGGGLPVGAFGGRRDLMEQMAPDGPVYEAGTLSGNPLAMRAGLANLTPLGDPGYYEALDAATGRLADGLSEGATRAGVPLTVNAVTGMLTPFFRDGPIQTLGEAEGSDTARYAAFFRAMLRRGFYLPPSQFEAWMLSSRHDFGIIDRTIAAAADAFHEIAAQ